MFSQSSVVMPDPDSYVYAGAPNGCCVRGHGFLAADLWKKIAGPGKHLKEAFYSNASCYRADAGDTNEHELNDAESTKWSTNAGQQLCC